MNLLKLSKRKVILVPWAVFFSIVFIGAGCSKPSPKGKDKAGEGQKGEIQSVRVIKVKPRPAVIIRSFPGQAKAVEKTMLSFRVSGYIQEMPIKTGQSVKKGEIIARIDSADYQDSLNKAKANLEGAKAKLKKAASAYQRDQELWASNEIDASQMDDSRANYISAKKEVEAAKEDVAKAKHDLGDTVIKAPFDGTIVNTDGNKFDLAEPGKLIAELVGDSGLEIKAYIPESYFLLRKQFKKYQCRFSAYPDVLLNAKLKGIGKKALPPVLAYPMTLVLDSEKKIEAYPGMEVEVLVTIGRQEEQKNVFELPSSAVTSGSEGQSIVWVYDQERGTVKSRPVVLAQFSSGGVEVSKGLKAGDFVVSAGGHFLKDGQKVRPLSKHNE